MTQEILITGASGQTGIELCRLDWPFKLWAPARTELDLADPGQTYKTIAGRAPAAIINAAAYTAVDRAESEPAAAFAINATGAAAIAHAARTLNAPLIHISTDYVFDGRKTGWYKPADAVAPLNVYGASKEAGEQAVRTVQPRSVVLRTAWIVSPHGRNFLKTVLRLASERPQLEIVADQYGCPTTANDLARALHKITLRMLENPYAPDGTFHFVNAGEATWHELAMEIMKQAASKGHPAPPVKAISTRDFPAVAARPANSRLDTASLTQAYGIQPRPWREAIAEAAGALLSRERQPA